MFPGFSPSTSRRDPWEQGCTLFKLSFKAVSATHIGRSTGTTQREKKNICVRVEKYLSRIMSLSFSCRYLKDIDTMNRLYCSLVRPLLEYSCETWNPHTKCNLDKLEAVQRRATRWITRSDDDYDTRLSKLKLLSLTNGRFTIDVTFLI